ncbi:MAG TPA: hypothetical protein PL029_08495 [Bacteroidia bacterium]|nr:hypothetical protein [Bacteroidia bacterium]
MKTNTLFKYVLILTGILLTKNSFFGNNPLDSLYFVEVKGDVMVSGNETSKSYKLELFRQNEVVESAIGVDNEPFLIRLQKNSQYTIVITKSGFLPFVISVNTHRDENKPQHQNYDFANTYFEKNHGFTMMLALNDK